MTNVLWQVDHNKLIAICRFSISVLLEQR
jgi:hypothetical protein